MTPTKACHSTITIGSREYDISNIEALQKNKPIGLFGGIDFSDDTEHIITERTYKVFCMLRARNTKGFKENKFYSFHKRVLLCIEPEGLNGVSYSVKASALSELVLERNDCYVVWGAFLQDSWADLLKRVWEDNNNAGHNGKGS